MDNTIITLNLRGKKFEIFKSTFDKLDLSDVRHVQITEDSYFIDKSPKYFHLILDCALCGKPLYPHAKDPFYIPYRQETDKAEYFYEEAEMFGLCVCNYYDTYIVGSYTEKRCKKHKQMLEEHTKNCNENSHHRCNLMNANN